MTYYRGGAFEYAFLQDWRYADSTSRITSLSASIILATGTPKYACLWLSTRVEWTSDATCKIAYDTRIGYGIVVLPAGAVLLNPTSDATLERVEGDADYLRGHIAAGSFSSDATRNSFAEDHPDAARAWALLQPRFVMLAETRKTQPTAGGTVITIGAKRTFDAAPGKKELSAALKRHKAMGTVNL